MKKKPKTKKPKKPALKKLKKELDRVFSIWVRSQGKSGYCKDMNDCFTCGKYEECKKLQAGHYISRSHMSLRWDKRNCHPQCVACNIFKKGNMDVYAIKLLAKYGDTILIDLHRAKHQIKRFTVQELQGLIEKYKIC